MHLTLLLVEDEPVLREGLCDLLRGAGHRVLAAADGPAALEAAAREAPDLVILDWMLPGMDGIEVCRRLRRERPAVPILLLTAKGGEDEKVRGLKAGADDYVTKPFGAKELLARVEALGRRARAAPADPEILQADGCRIDLGKSEVRRGRRIESLTPREAGILRWLHRHRNRSVPRSELLEQVWGAPGDLETRTVDMAVANLRRKLERDPSEPRILVSVKGVGYAWGANE